MSGRQTSLTLLLIGVATIWGIGTASLIGLLYPTYVATFGWVLVAAIYASALARPFRNTGTVTAIVCAFFFLAVQLFQLAFLIEPRAQSVGISTNWLANTIAPNLNLPKIVLSGLCLIIAGVLGDVVVRNILRIGGQLEQDAAIIQELTVRDGLTGTVKRSHAEMMLTAEIERSRRYKRPFSLLILGPDDWASVIRERDREGAMEALRGISDTILKGVRTIDIVARYDESRFMVVLPETPGNGAAVVADRLCKEVAAITSIRFRCGVAEFPTDGVAKSELLDEAEAALEFARRTDIIVATRSALAS